MSAYNTVLTTLKCPSCEAENAVIVQFKFANTWQFQYRVGDALQWGGNDVGVQGALHVVVDGIVEDECLNCHNSGQWSVYVHIEGDRIARLENANGEFDFVKAKSNYIVLE